MRSLFILCFMLLIPYTTFSQSGIKFSLFAEPKITWTNSDADEKVTNKGASFGFNGGLTMDMYFTPRYAFSSVISLNSINSRLKAKEKVYIGLENGMVDSVINESIKYNLQYVNVPVGLKLETDPIGMVTICSKVGVIPQINVKSDAIYDSSEKNVYNNEINLFNALYQIGAGVEYGLGGGSAFSVMLLYRNSFLDITKEQKDELDDKITFRNVGLQISLIF